MRCENLKKIYNAGTENECIVFENLSIEFPDKGLVFICGKSGSGKSTFINILSGLEKADGGHIYDGELELTSFSEKEMELYRRNNIGYVFQNYQLINDLSVQENVNLCSEEFSQSQEKILKLLELDGKENARPSALSGGQQQRVSIGRALVKKSKIIIADEPTGNLDSENAIKVFKLLKDISKTRLVIVVTHDMENAEKYGDRIITIIDGKVTADTCENYKEIALSIEIIKTKEKNIDDKSKIKRLAKVFGKNKKISGIFFGLISIFLVSLIGILIDMHQFDFNAIMADYTAENNMENFGISKGFVNTLTHSFQTGPRPMDKEDKQILENNMSELDTVYNISGMYITFGSTGSKYMYPQVYSAVETQEEHLDNYGLTSLYGSFPSDAKEIAITDYMAYVISVLKPETILNILDISSLTEIDDDKVLISKLKNLNSMKMEKLFGDKWKSEISKNENITYIREHLWILLLDEKIDFYSNEFLISQILGSDYEQYTDLIYLSEKDLVNESDANEFSYKCFAIYLNFYVNNEFINNCYDNGIILFSNCASVSETYYEKITGEKLNLKGTDIYMSDNYFRNYFKEEYTVANKDQYLLGNEFSVTYGQGGPRDVYFESEDSKVLGVLQVPADFNALFANEQFVVYSEDFFEQQAKAVVYPTMYYGKVKGDTEVLFKEMNDKDLYQVSLYTGQVYEFRNIYNVFKGLFFILLLLIMFISIMCMYLYFGEIIKLRQKEIGILKAMGFSQTEIHSIFYIIAAKMFIVLTVMGYILMTVGRVILNNVIKDSYFMYANVSKMVSFTVISGNVASYAFVFVIEMVTIFLAIIFPLKRIDKLSPMTVIRND